MYIFPSVGFSVYVLTFYHSEECQTKSFNILKTLSPLSKNNLSPTLGLFNLVLQYF